MPAAGEQPMPATTDAHPEKDQLVAFGLGKLDPAATSQIEQHLEACQDAVRRF
jgi:hypothetical protein